MEAGVDVLFAIGTSFGEVATNSWNQVIKASQTFIQLDIDAAQIGRNYRADIGLVGPAEVLIRQLLERVPKTRRQLPVGGIERLTDPSVFQHGLIQPQRAIWELQQVMPQDTIYCVDIGDHLLFALHYLQLDRPDCFYFSGLASMGSGIGASIGIKLALPNRPVVCICGDGTMTMAGTELLTATQEKLPIVYAVLNDGRYGMVERGNQHIFGRTPTYPSSPLDIAGMARQMGMSSIRIDRPSQILDFTRQHLAAAEGPLLLDISVDLEASAPGTERFDSLTGDIQ
jgi:acetolactate synthase-1/2/3 large subunit